MLTPAETDRELNRLAKWRSVFTGRILGTRSIEDPQSQGFRDLFEKLLLQRAEISAITKLLLDKGIFTPEELTSQVGEEAKHLADSIARYFPGMTATDDGIQYDVQVAVKTMKGWPP